MKAKLALTALVAFAGTAAAQDGLVVAVDDPNVPVFVYQNGGWSELFNFANTEDAWGLASVSADERIYFNDGSQLYWWAEGQGVNNVGTINVGGTSTSMVGLTFNPNDGFLYATRNIGGDGGTTPEALYRIDRTTGAATVALDYASLDFDFGGIGFDIVSGRLFGVNDDGTPQSGLYEINPTDGNITLISAYPTGETDIDGLAVYDNTAYLVTDEPGSFYSIDVNNAGDGYTAFDGPFTSSDIFSGATVAEWLIPAPSSLALLGLGGLAAARRRR